MTGEATKNSAAVAALLMTFRFEAEAY